MAFHVRSLDVATAFVAAFADLGLAGAVDSAIYTSPLKAAQMQVYAAGRLRHLHSHGTVAKIREGCPMSRFAWLGLAVVALAAAPASAATYTGKLFGTITDGTADYIDLTNSTPGAFFRIAGYPIEIDFVSVVTKNYVDSKNILIPTYVSSHADISIKIPPPLGSLNENFSNDTNINLFQGSDFFGTARDGFFNLGGTTPDGNFQGGIVLNFQGAAPTFGSLTGNGVGNATIHDTVAEMQDVTSFSFTLDHGFVFATGTPEPEAWALMILGFGLVGGMLRRREHVEPVGLTAN